MMTSMILSLVWVRALASAVSQASVVETAPIFARAARVAAASAPGRSVTKERVGAELSSDSGATPGGSSRSAPPDMVGGPPAGDWGGGARAHGVFPQVWRGPLAPGGALGRGPPPRAAPAGPAPQGG